MESFELGGTPKGHLAQLPCNEQGRSCPCTDFDGTGGGVRVVPPSPYGQLERQKPHSSPDEPKPGCDENGAESLRMGEEIPACRHSAGKRISTQAALSLQHAQLLPLKSVTSLVNHPLFISKSYVKLCTTAFRLPMGKRRDGASERPGKTKAEKPLKFFAWEIVTCSYI